MLDSTSRYSSGSSVSCSLYSKISVIPILSVRISYVPITWMLSKISIIKTNVKSRKMNLSTAEEIPDIRLLFLIIHCKLSPSGGVLGRLLEGGKVASWDLSKVLTHHWTPQHVECKERFGRRSLPVMAAAAVFVAAVFVAWWRRLHCCPEKEQRLHRSGIAAEECSSSIDGCVRLQLIKVVHIATWYGQHIFATFASKAHFMLVSMMALPKRRGLFRFCCRYRKTRIPQIQRNVWPSYRQLCPSWHLQLLHWLGFKQCCAASSSGQSSHLTLQSPWWSACQLFLRPSCTKYCHRNSLYKFELAWTM